MRRGSNERLKIIRKTKQNEAGKRRESDDSQGDKIDEEERR